MLSSKRKNKNQQYVFSSVMKNNSSSFRNTDSFRQTLRRPIFQKQLKTNNKVMARSSSVVDNSSFFHIKPTIHDDFCGCEHTLQICPKIKEVIKNVNLAEMRSQYENNEKLQQKKSKIYIRQKYFQYLPSYYPEIFQAHLINIVTNLGQNLSINDFLTIAWIQYHSKVQHLTYFMYVDLKRSQITKRNFHETLQLQMIKYQSEASNKNISLKDFIDNYFETNGANFVPLAYYADLINILLKRGYKYLIKLLAFLFCRKRDAVFRVIKHGPIGNNLRESSRQLPWESYFQEIKSKNNL